MRILDRYIATRLLKGYGTVLLILVAIFSFLAFVEELDSVGKGNYGTADAWLYVALTLPRRMLELVPASALLGGIVGLEKLSSGSELVAIRASGISIYGFSGSVARFVLVLVTVMIFFGQFVAPPLAQFAEKERALAIKSRMGLVASEKGSWARDERQTLHIGEMWEGQVPLRIELYQFDAKGALVSYVQAERADVGDHDQWTLEAVRQKAISEGAVIQHNFVSMKWKSFLGESQLQVLQSPVETLSISGLYKYIRYLRDTGQKSDHVELILWKKLISPLNVATLALLVVPLGFAHHPMNMMRQFTLGAGVGIFFFLLTQLSTSVGMAAKVSPPLVALFPLTVLVSFTSYLFWKISSRTR
jgi:lipopolysaccharide export system permease protein